MPTLRDSFLQALPADLRERAAGVAELDARLDALLERARDPAERFVEDAAFLDHVAGHLQPDDDLLRSLETVCAADLYLACACTRGSERAIERFRDRLGGPTRAAAARSTTPDAVDEVVQETLTKLLVPDGDAPPAIAKYAGRGRLSKWVQTVALRLGRSRSRKRTEELADNIETLADRMMEAGDIELDALKRTYRAQFKAAFRSALEGLTPRQRNVLRLELLDRLTIDAIARVHGVHAATVFRWRADTRTLLLDGTRKVFENELNVGRSEFQSIMRLIQSQLDVSLPRLLEDGKEDQSSS